MFEFSSAISEKTGITENAVIAVLRLLEEGATVFVEEATSEGFIVSSMEGYELLE